MTFKNVSEHLLDYPTPLIITGNARDFGIQARFPIVELAEHIGRRSLSIADRWELRFDLTTGFAWNNLGDDLIRPDGFEELFPTYRRTGWASVLGVSWKEERFHWDLFKFTGTFEKYTLMVGTVDEQRHPDDIKGWEFSLLDILEIRRGTYDDNARQRHLETTGYTLKSDGCFSLIQLLKWEQSKPNRWLNFIVDHLSISWTKFEQKDASRFSNTSHTEFKILF